MKLLVTGAGGLVGRALSRSLLDRHQVHGTFRHRPAPAGLVAHHVELAEPGAFQRVVDEIGPDLVVHTAYSMGDLERDVVAATDAVASACRVAGVDLIHLSTDAVFDGEHAPYAEADLPRPVHPYGVAKRRAELAVLESVPGASVVRTALIAHLDRDEPDSGSRWLLEAQERGEIVTMFTDEIRSVVRLVDLVAVISVLAERDASERAGIWHVGGPDRLSRWDLGEIAVRRLGLDRSLIRAGSASTMGGPRPRDVSLSCERLAQLSVLPQPIDTVADHGQANR